METIIHRRLFFQIAGTGVAGYFLSPFDLLARRSPSPNANPASITGTAKNAIFVFLPGAPSQFDTFDLRVDSWTPEDFRPTTINGIDFPEGLLPNIAQQLDKISIVRSCQASALVHSLLQAWNQIARNPTSATGKIAPNIGSIVALETERNKTKSQPLPGFLSLNTGGNLIRQGYLPGRYSPFDVTAAPGGLANLQNPDGQATFNDRFELLLQLNHSGITRAEFAEIEDFYQGSRSIMYDPTVNAAFRFTQDEQQLYGNSAFGNSCIVARNLIKADLGTRYIQINLGGWDNHQNIYQRGAGIYRPASQLDPGLANLIADLAASPGSLGRSRLDETIIVVKGEFGRTVGPLTARGGRDHYFPHFTLFAGGGVKGGRVIGSTTSDGLFVENPGWSQSRPVGAEDVAATIYSALGIDYTTVRRDDPIGRGFEYVTSNNWAVYPILELF